MVAFSFLECVEKWDQHPFLRRRAREMQVLVADSKKRRTVLPTLTNMALNQALLRPFTQAMANQGMICRSVGKIKEAVWEFYLQELPEEQRGEVFKLRPKVKRTTGFISMMLTRIKRKWSRWEMPRVP